MAYRLAKSCKRYRHEFLNLERNRMINLHNIQQSVANGTYTISDYQYFVVYEPKRREIMKLPAQDRIVQHMWNNVVNPIVDNRLYYHTYACRVGKGVHAASQTLSNWLYHECYIGGNKLYAIKGDIHSYFASINHNVLKTHIRRIIGDSRVLWLTDTFIDNNGRMPDGVGIPVGNLSSQLFANIYGDILDKFVKYDNQCEYYIRYMDDFVILGNDYHELERLLERIAEFLHEVMLVELNPKSNIVYVLNGLDFVGFIHYPDHVIARKRNKQNLIRFIKRYPLIDDFYEYDNSLQSRIGFLTHSDSYKFIYDMLDSIPDYFEDREILGWIRTCKEEQYDLYSFI